MNEQIKELHKQAFDWVQYQLQTVGSDHPVTQKEQLEMVNQKFAKLIIEECVDYAFANGDNVDYLKQYFGVEE